MIKVRITYSQTEKGRMEVEEAIKNISNNFFIINKSKEYKGRGNSLYSNIYLDMEKP